MTVSPRKSSKPAKKSTSGVKVQKAKSNVYTMMLFLSVVAIGVAIGILCAEMSTYDWDWKAQQAGLRPRPNVNVNFQVPQQITTFLC